MIWSKDLTYRFFYKEDTSMADQSKWGPLAHWNSKVETITKLRRESVAEPYRLLI